MLKKILIGAVAFGVMTTVAKADLKSDLNAISKEAESCIKKQDCTDFILKNDMAIKIMGNEDYVNQLNKCNPGTKCYAWISRASALTIQAVGYVKY